MEFTNHLDVLREINENKDSATADFTQHEPERRDADMSKKQKRKNVRQSEFRVVARGVHRPKPDISRLMQASLDFYLACKEHEAQAEVPRRRDGGSDVSA